MCGCLSHAPYWGPGPQPRYVPWPGIELVTPWSKGRCSIHGATPAGAAWLFLINRCKHCGSLLIFLKEFTNVRRRGLEFKAFHPKSQTLPNNLYIPKYGCYLCYLWWVYKHFKYMFVLYRVYYTFLNFILMSCIKNTWHIVKIHDM